MLPPGFRLLFTLTAPGASAIHRLAWSPDGGRIASGGSDNMVRIWDSVSGQRTLTLSGHTGTFSVAWSPDGRPPRLGRAGRHRCGSGIVLFGHTFQVIVASDDPLFAVAWSPDVGTIEHRHG